MARTHFFLLALSLSALFASADLSVSIRCGSSGFYVDENSIIWMGDDNLTQNGEARAIQNSNSSPPQVMPTLRVFTTRKKNCYSIKVDKWGRVLVRASFNYGNYDGKNSPPTFALQFDGNDWATVKTLATEIVSYEVVYVVKGDVMSVCVAQTMPDQFPFMSALEVRGLGSNMYSHVGAEYGLWLRERTAFGTNAIVRYPDDPYDRIWYPEPARNGLLNVTTHAPNITVDVQDNPPESVIGNAITTRNTSQYITLTPPLPDIPIQIYLTMYFSEVTQLDSTQKRSFMVFKDNQSFSDPVVPPFGNVTELYASDVTVYPNTSFYLLATPGSTLPPLINAMEVFGIAGPLTDGTDTDDVVGLASLQSKFDVLQGWGGDPCLPAPYSWEWISCTSDATPRVTALYLGSFGLVGSLPDFSSMTALVTIDMDNNSISGPIPNFLGTLPNLKELNLANNQLTGSIPASLSNNNRLKLVVTGNPNLCTSGQCPILPSSGSTKKKNNLPAILGAAIPAFIIFWAIVGVVAIFHRKRKTAAVAAIDADLGELPPHARRQIMLRGLRFEHMQETRLSRRKCSNMDRRNMIRRLGRAEKLSSFGKNVGANHMTNGNGTRQGNAATAEIVGIV